MNRKHQKGHYLRAMACLVAALSIQSSAQAVPETVSRFLELEGEIPLQSMGVNLRVAIARDGAVYLGSTSQARIWHLDQNQEHWIPLYPRTAGQGQPGATLYPESLVTDRQGHLWIADSLRRQVWILDTDTVTIRRVGNTGRLFRKPVFLSQADSAHIAAWDRDTKALFLIPEHGGTMKRQELHTEQHACLPGDKQTLYCLDANQKTLVKYVKGNAVTRHAFASAYPRAGHIARGPDGDLYVTDTAGKQLWAFNSDLKPTQHFYLYEPLFRSPTHFAFHADQLWLVDEGRQSLLRFRLRTASSALEHALLGEEYLAVDRPGQALDEFQSAGKLGLASSELALLTGQAFYRMQRYTKALGAFDLALQREPTNARAGFWRGNALYRLGRYEQAEVAYGNVPEGDPDHTLARFNLAQTYLSLNRHAKARELFAELLDQQPDNAASRLGLAMALIGLNLNTEATVQLEAIIEDGPAARHARYHLGHLRMRQGDTAAAVPLLERASREGPHYRAALRDLAEAYRHLGRTEQARKTEHKLSRITPIADSIQTYLIEDES